MPHNGHYITKKARLEFENKEMASEKKGKACRSETNKRGNVNEGTRLGKVVKEEEERRLVEENKGAGRKEWMMKALAQ